MRLPDRIKITGKVNEEFLNLMSLEAAQFLIELSEKFSEARTKILEQRTKSQKAIDSGDLPSFLPHRKEVHEDNWRVAPAPPALENRTVEITGPVDRKMMINALNSGANGFMADIEDSLSPTWDNVVNGHINLYDATRHNLNFESPDGSKSYSLNKEIATLLVRPRGWHLLEKHVLIDNKPLSASLFDFGLHFFNNAKESLKRGLGPYYYLPKLESHKEAKLWNDVFVFAQNALGIEQGTIRATVLIETLPAAFEMEEILFELRDHMAGLNAGRWDYIFSCIKRLRNHKDYILPDRSQVGMTAPFMRAYTERLVHLCHKHGAHAMGGMAAFIPTKKDPEINEMAIAKVKEDKSREANDGFDGTWVAHPGLVSIARDEFQKVLGTKPNQKDNLRNDVNIVAKDLLNTNIDGGKITEEGIRKNASIGLQYIYYWINGQGCVALENLMEDAATAEISRAQLWQWVHHNVDTADGKKITADFVEKIIDDEVRKISIQDEKMSQTVKMFKNMIINNDFAEFLTLEAYEKL